MPATMPAPTSIDHQALLSDVLEQKHANPQVYLLDFPRDCAGGYMNISFSQVVAN
jgi:hypothetical protein